MQRGNQHGDRWYDDLQNLLDMMSHENPLSLSQIIQNEQWCSYIQSHFDIVCQGFETHPFISKHDFTKTNIPTLLQMYEINMMQIYITHLETTIFY